MNLFFYFLRDDWQNNFTQSASTRNRGRSQRSRRKKEKKRFHQLSFSLVLLRLNSPNVRAYCHLLLLVARTFANVHTHTNLSIFCIYFSPCRRRGEEKRLRQTKDACADKTHSSPDRKHDLLLLTISDMCSMSLFLSFAFDQETISNRVQCKVKTGQHHFFSLNKNDSEDNLSSDLHKRLVEISSYFIGFSIFRFYFVFSSFLLLFLQSLLLNIIFILVVFSSPPDHHHHHHRQYVSNEQINSIFNHLYVELIDSFSLSMLIDIWWLMCWSSLFIIEMEVTSSLSKTFKRFTIPRSTSSMGSFTTSNGTATNIELNFEDSATPPSSSSQTTDPPPSNGHKHPPLSYAQHIRPLQHLSQQNLSSNSSQQVQPPSKSHFASRPLSGDISTLITRSSSTDFHALNEPKVNFFLFSSIQLWFFDVFLAEKIFVLQIVNSTWYELR